MASDTVPVHLNNYVHDSCFVVFYHGLTQTDITQIFRITSFAIIQCFLTELKGQQIGMAIYKGYDVNYLL